MNAFMSYKFSTKNLTLNEDENENENDDDDENEQKKIFFNNV